MPDRVRHRGQELAHRHRATALHLRRVRRIGQHLRRRCAQDRPERVAEVVVARVQLLAGRAAVDRLLLRRLGLLRAGKNAARRDTQVGESDVIRAAVERDLLRREPLRGPEVGEDPLDLARTGRAGRIALDRAVAVVDEAGEVGRGDHVEVEHDHDLRDLLRRQVLGVVGRADEPVLLAAPPGEPDFLTRVEAPASDLLRDLELGRAARTVVVDPRPRGNGVEMRADHDHVVRIAARRLREHLWEEAVIDLRVDRQAHRRVLACLERLVELLADRVARVDRRDPHPDRPRPEERVHPIRRVALVEEDHRCGAGLLGQVELLHERAGAALDQRDRARGLRREVLRFAAAGASAGARDLDVAGRHDRRIRDAAGGRLLEADEVHVWAVVVVRGPRDVGLLRVDVGPAERRGRVLDPPQPSRGLIDEYEVYVVAIVWGVGNVRVLGGRRPIAEGGRRRERFESEAGLIHAAATVP